VRLLAPQGAWMVEGRDIDRAGPWAALALGLSPVPAAASTDLTLAAPLVQAVFVVFLVLLLVVLWLARQQVATVAALRRQVAAQAQRLAERDAALADASQRLGELHTVLKDMSLRDSLTGLYNRRCLDQVLLEAWKNANVRHEPLALLMIDIDHFKQLNDKYGHAAGDDCLREVAQRLQHHATTLGGVVARYGGEEFVVVLAQAGIEMAHAAAEALRNAVCASPVNTTPAPLWVTVSIGAASASPGTGGSLGATLKRADEALYAAKGEGRNRVVLR
jgi:diguanylate cyclase (GGDEF)-like protein